MNEIKELLAEIVGLLSEQNESAKEILNVDEAARVLNLSKSHVYKLAQRRELAYFCPAGKKYYFKRSDLIEYLTRYRTASADEIQTQANAIIYRKRR